VICKPLKPVEDLPGNDFFAGLRYEPMIQKNRRSRIAKSADTYFGLPEASLKIVPVSAAAFR
jgi:hypothetical protein